MSCCICGEQCSKMMETYTYFTKEIIKFDIAFCEKHYFIHDLKSDEKCEETFHIHGKNNGKLLIAIFLLSQLKSSSHINVVLKGLTMHDTLVKMSKIDLMLYRAAILIFKKIKIISIDIIFLFSSIPNIPKTMEEHNYFLEKNKRWVLLCENNDGFTEYKMTLNKKKYYHNPSQNKYNTDYQCDYCKVLYQSDKYVTKIDDNKLKCKNCVIIEEIIIDLFHLEYMFTSEDYLKSIIACVSKHCSLIILNFLFDSDIMNLFSKIINKLVC